MTSKNSKGDSETADSLVYNYDAGRELPALEYENRVLRETISQLKEELDKFKNPPLVLCDIIDVFDKQALVRLQNGNVFLVDISSGCEPLVSGDSVLVEQKNLVIIRKAPKSKRFNVEQFVIIESPDVGWQDIGGLSTQIQEIQEVVELPLKKPGLFRKVGITPPKGILLYGEPGTGKTLLAKAVASSTKSAFIEIVGSELIQKFIGEGAKLVKEIFELAREKAPAIIFIDELDALAAKRIEIGTSGEREVQRTFMQLLAEIDGFKSLSNIKVIACTNRKDILDPAILRPGRLDRLIKIELPDPAGRLEIFKIHTKRMTLAQDVNIKRLIEKMDSFSGAEIRAAVTEAGYFAIRQNRRIVTMSDLVKGIDKVKASEEREGDDYLNMFG